MTDNIIIKTENRVTTLTINRVDKKNALTQAMYGAMADAIVSYGDEDTARAFVITGAGDMFTSGNDLKDFSTGMADDEVPPVGRFLNAIVACPKPLIAAVNGPAIGVGLTMLLHCDLVYGGQSSTYHAPFVQLGLVPEASSSLLLPAQVGMAVANDILLGGRKLSADEALQFGLISRVFTNADLLPQTSKIALGVANSAPMAVLRSKALIRHHREQVAAHMDVESGMFAKQLTSPDFAESIAAMTQRRAPVYP